MKEGTRATVVNLWRTKELDQDFDHVVQAVEESKGSTDLIVFPERSLVGFRNREEYEDRLKGLKALSRRLGMLICVGAEEPQGGKRGTGPLPYNAAVLIEGDTVHTYRKNHLVWDEPEESEPGNLGFPVFDTAVGKVGVLVCYDNEFPESMRCLKVQGAEIVLLPAAWPVAYLEFWDLYTRVRARENQVFLLAANDCSTQPCPFLEGSSFIEYGGNSRIVDPLGQVRVNIDGREKPFTRATLTLDAHAFCEVKRILGPNTDPWANRRPGLYKELCRS
jgi:predicted amidohydrolase